MESPVAWVDEKIDAARTAILKEAKILALQLTLDLLNHNVTEVSAQLAALKEKV